MAQRIIHILLFFVLFIYCGSKVVGQSFFGKPKELTETYYKTNGIQTADFNSDGLLDIMQYTPAQDGRIVIRYQIEDGVFDDDNVILRNLFGLQEVILLDVDNDGDLDLCASTSILEGYSNSGNRLLLIENENGTFESPVVILLPASSLNLIAQDWDADGRCDLVFLMYNEIHWMRNLNDFEFATAISIYSLEQIQTFQLAKLNDDEEWDIVGRYYNSQSNFRRYFSTIQINNNEFEAYVDLANAPVEVKNIAVLDLDNNGLDECVLQTSASNELQVFINDGQGDLLLQESFNIVSKYVRLGDYDNNGLIDIAYFGSTSIGLLVNNNQSWNVLEVTDIGTVYAAQFQDLNNDGFSDLLFYSQPSLGFDHALAYLKSNEGLEFDSPIFISLTHVAEAFNIADFGMNNTQDVVSISSSSGVAIVYPNDGSGAFEQARILPTGYDFSYTANHDVIMADIDLDFDLDILYALNGFNEGLVIAEATSNDDFSVSWLFPEFYFLCIQIGNMNNDQYPDLLLKEMSNGSYYFAMNTGNGTFDSPVPLQLDLELYFGGIDIDTRVQLFDHDGDNIADFIGRDASYNYKFYHGNGDGTFSVAQNLNFLSDWKLVNMADFNLDGQEDVLVFDNLNASSDLKISLNQGDFLFTEYFDFSLDGVYLKTKFVDFDNDNYIDVFAAVVDPETAQERFYIIHNNNGISFSMEMIYEYDAVIDNSLYFNFFEMVDLDLDGALDILFDANPWEVFWLRNLTPYCQNFAPTISANQTICEGESRTLQVSGGGVYNWEFDHFGSSYDVQPDTTATYNVWVCNDIGCADTLSTTITVLPVAEIEISVIDADLHASPFDDVIWYKVGDELPLGTGSDYTAVQNGEYYYVYENANGCQQVSDIAVVSFFCQTFAPTISAGQMVCPGSSVMLSAAGGDNYLWPDGSVGDTYEFVANEPTEVQVEISTVNFCSATLSSQIEFFETPELVIIENGPDLVATGAENVEWFSPDNEVALGIGDLFTPAENGYYFVKSESVDGCELVSDTIHFLYFCYLFTPSITPDQTVCPGTSVVIEAQGGDNYQWSNGASGSMLEALPLSNTIYELYVATDNGCSDTLSTSVTLFDIQETQVAFNGSSLEATSGNDITWYETGSTDPLDTGEQFAPNQSGNYYYTSQSENGCAQISDSLSFDFCTTLFAPALIGETTICPGESATLEASGGDNYAWSTGFVGDVYEVNPEESTTYEVYITTSGGCADTLIAFVDVSELPQITVAIDSNTINASVSPADANVTWVNALSNEVIGNGLSVVPDENGFYFAITENEDMCTIYSDTLEYLYYGIEVIGSSPLHIYPNPGSDWIMITGEESVVISEVSLYDLGGRQIHASMNTTGSGIYQLPSHLPAGAYIISITCEDDSVLRMMWVRE